MKPTTGSRMASWLPWALGGTFMLAYFVRDLLTFDHGRIGRTDFWGRDFINVWTGGQLFRAGRVSTIFDVHAYIAFQRSLFGPIEGHNYSYPPPTYWLAEAFSLLPYWLALATWLAGTGALFVVACRRWWPEGVGPVWLAVLTPAAIVNIWGGHYGFLVGALFLLGWQWLDDHPKRAGVAFGLMLIKPHMALLIPLVLLIRREWSAIAIAAATVLALVAGTILCFGWAPWADFLFHVAPGQASMVDARGTFFGLMSTSTAMALTQVGVPISVALAVQAAVAIAAVALVATAALRGMPTRELALLTATCTFLALPYAFNYDLTVVCFGALALMKTPGVSQDQYRAGFYGFIAPQVGMIAAALGVPLMPFMLAGLAAGQFHCWGPRRWRAAAPKRLAVPASA